LSSIDRSAARWQGENLIVQVRVQPRASKNEIQGVEHGQLRVRTTAAPTDGKANKAVIRLLANYLGVPQSRITLTRGLTHRNKQVSVAGPIKVPGDLPVATRVANGL
jgi:uncharacterized protein (TIGR00251 family)